MSRGQVITPERALEEMRGRIHEDWKRTYMAANTPRYLTLARKVSDLKPNGPRRVLDVGPAMQTEMLRKIYPEVTIDTLGFADEITDVRPHERHVEYDLEHVSVPSTWPELPGEYDIILLAEVLEHLNVRPLTLLECLAGELAPGGHLIIGTPNAAYLLKRIRSAFGRHPYGPTHDMTGNGVPLAEFCGHFREYLLEELVGLGQAAGLEVVSTEYINDYAYQHRPGRMLGRIVPFLPRRFHMLLMVVLRRPA